MCEKQYKNEQKVPSNVDNFLQAPLSDLCTALLFDIAQWLVEIADKNEKEVHKKFAEGYHPRLEIVCQKCKHRVFRRLVGKCRQLTQEKII